MFGNGVTNVCFFKNGPALNDLLEVISTSGVCVVTILYCFGVSAAVVVKLSNSLAYHRPDSTCEPWGKEYSVLSLKNLVLRTCLYPAVCFLSNLGNCAIIIYVFLTKSTESWLFAWAYWGVSLQGLLHLVAFLADPAVSKLMPRLMASQPCKEERERQCLSDAQSLDEIDFTFDVVMAPPGTEDSPEILRNRMVKEFHRYI